MAVLRIFGMDWKAESFAALKLTESQEMLTSLSEEERKEERKKRLKGGGGRADRCRISPARRGNVFARACGPYNRR